MGTFYLFCISQDNLSAIIILTDAPLTTEKICFIFALISSFSGLLDQD